MDNKKFNTDIWRLNNSMVELMLEVERSLIELSKAVKSADTQLMEELVGKDATVNTQRDFIERECLRILMKRHPFARDLRQVLAIFKTISDVERISDNIRDICEGIIANSGVYCATCEKSLDKVFKLGDNVIDIFSMSIKAFATLDEECANKVVEFDDVVDELYNEIKAEIAESLEAGTKVGRAWLTLVSTVKHYEKIGDHCVNTAEWTRYILTGDRK